MHFRTHIAERHRGKSGGQGDYADRMVEHDEHIGMMLDKLDELGIADNTIVMYSTDNGPHYNSWPDAGITPSRSEKDTNWEGAWRVPAFVRWPGQVQGRHRAERHRHPPGLAADAAGGRRRCRTSRRSCSTATRLGDKTFKVHIDGYNMLPYFTGEVEESPRNFFFYFSDDGEVMAVRFGDWKLSRWSSAPSSWVWIEPFVQAADPQIFNLRRDPFERAQRTRTPTTTG